MLRILFYIFLTHVVLHFTCSYDVQYWLIEKTAINEYLVLEFRDIHMEDSVDCIYDRLTFFDGNFSLVVRKTVFGVSDKARFKPDCTTRENG